MSSKKPKASAADDNIDDLFSGLDTGSKPKPTKAKKPATAAASSAAAGSGDILAELESELTSEKPSRPHTPRVKDASAVKQSPSAVRKSTDSARSLRHSFTPSASGPDPHEDKKAPVPHVEETSPVQEESGGGWWGGLLSTATAAMKQAEAAVKEIQRNEEAQRWAEQVRGNIGALQGLSDEFRQRALPTFTNILHTLAPPISAHEKLMVHITHDFVGYPSLDPTIQAAFARVMAQVEGGDLMVVQRGQESSGGSSAAGWQDGPWWRQSGVAREVGVVAGLVEGTKLCRASAEGFATEYFNANGGLDEAKVRATEALSESNPVRTSNLFLAVQAISTPGDNGLFARSSAKEKEADDKQDEDESDGDEVRFAFFVLDPIHQIEFSTVSQAVPAKWIRWLDAPAGKGTKQQSDDEEEEEGEESEEEDEDGGRANDGGTLPDEIREIIESGGLDPREWISEWVEEVLSLSVGIVAQCYVAQRMGVGDGALGKGKRRTEDIMEDGAGEAARAGLI